MFGQKEVSGNSCACWTYQVTRNIHKFEIVRTAQLHLWTFEEAVVLIADELCIIYSLLRNISDARIRAYDADVVWVRIKLVQRDMLANKDTNAYSTHVEPVQECLYRTFYLLTLFFVLLELKYALCYGCHDWIMPLLDLDQGFRESFVVVVHFRRPVHFQAWIGIVSTFGVQQDMIRSAI